MRSLSCLILCWFVHGVSGVMCELVSFDTVNIAEEMRIGTGETGLPESLQGLWWMDGVPYPEVVLSFGGSIWDADSRTLIGNPLEEGVMAFNDDLLGSLYYGLYGATQASMVVQFNEDITSADISLNVRVLGMTIPLPQWFMSFTMFLVEDGLWDRDTSVIFFVPVGSYKFRRIVTADGEPTDRLC